uniref:cubilin-like n=1 Tax=Styela clava TaxID=7725 RepID=UPI0019393731|nr:cubilin-like [Styela clava]
MNIINFITLLVLIHLLLDTCIASESKKSEYAEAKKYSRSRNAGKKVEEVEMKKPSSKKSLYAISTQPRMYTANGHLIFETSGTYNISFRTNNQGSINFDDIDLKPVFDQIEKNRQDIIDIKNSGGGSIPPDLQNQVDTNKQNIGQLQTQANDHNSRLDDLEAKYATLQTTVTTIQNDLNDDDCSSSPCQNGGTCTDLYKSFACACPSQYEGPTCEIDHDECIDFQQTGIGCQNGGTCVNLPGGFQCNCPNSYYGPLCTSLYDDCFDGNVAKCVHGVCINSPRDDPNVPKYTCVCENGWQSVSDTNPECSKDVDECLNSPCSSNPSVQCYNTQGSYTCGNCPNGYQGNGYTCEDVNECLVNNGGCSQSPMVTCINVPGTSYCSACPAGYTGDGYTCTQQDPCTNNGGCHPIATCSYNPAIGSVSCTCPPGYNGNGVGPFGCTLTETNCTDTSCVNGQCVLISGVLTCLCDPGWIGDNCDYNSNECSSNPCQNGGTCVDGINGYSCSCNSGYTGTNCELQQTSCGGEYMSSTGSFQFPANTGETYPQGASCTWTIIVTDGKVISATFPQFKIESSSGCVDNFLQINDGPSLSSQLIGTFCGTTPPGNGDALISTSHQLFLWYYSDGDPTDDVFQVVWTTADPVCGGDISGQDYGVVSSPGYPGVYPTNRDCYWSITVLPGNIIQFLFGAIAIEDHDDCTADYLEIRDGILLNDPVLVKYCTSVSPSPLLTTAPGALIHFHSDSVNQDNGFHITWSKQPVGISGCGGYFTEDDGIIISPNYPNTYNDDQQCVWQIHIQENGKISITFTDFDIPTDVNCATDYLEVRDGPSESSPLVARYCGTTIPPMYTSSGRDLYIKFKADQSLSGRGFRLTYTVACGGTYTAESGTLLSPYYPSNYPNDKECFYTIVRPPGFQITLTVVEIDVEEDPTCSKDYLEVHDGGTEESPLLSLMCGRAPVPPMISTQNILYAHFKSDSQNTGSGFKATYTSTNTGCGGVYTDTVGSIKSPGHPSPYPHGVNCTYYIWVDPSLIISLQFLTFSLEPPTNGICVKDYVEIFDGPDITSPSLGRFCGSVLPPTLVTKSYEMTLFFTTDDNEDSQGFAAGYTTLNASTACGGRITDQQGYISSPNYPDLYPSMRTCVWTIVMPSSVQIQVDFPDFDFEGGNAEGTCSFDYLEIRNGGYEDSPLIGEYCGNNNPGTFISHSNELYIKMVTDELKERRGFLMNYNGGLTGCGGTLTSADGGFQSPNYPFPYPHSTDCFWLIQVSEGSSVRLLFVNFDIETHGFCEFDYVEAYDGPTIGYPSLGKVCGTRIPEPFESSDNSLLVKFSTDGNTAGSGFVAQYHTDCDRTISSKVSGLIQSLDYPGSYPPNRDCTWTIQGSYGNPLNATFRTFSLETCDNCNCDYVEVFDGTDSDAESFGKFCGTQIPPIIRTTGENMQIVFHTDPYTQAPGFEIAWAVDGCGKTFQTPSGEFASPNYPNNYDDNRECIWQIITSIGTSVQLTIDDFDVEHHSDCQYDTLEVYNGLNIEEDFRIAQLCNAANPPQIPMHVTSSSSLMTVRFITDALVSGRGFHASFEEKAGGCGGSLTSTSGTITSPNYPNTYPANTDCEWVIDVGKGSTVVIEFEVFEIEEEEVCEFDYVAMYDGNSTSDTLLLKTCGRTLPPLVQSYDNLMLFQFHSDPFTAHMGFKAHYSAGCGGKIIASNSKSNAITSPNYPNNYPADANCTWTISAPQPNGRITLQFTQLDLYSNVTYNGPCGPYDYIQILGGKTTSSPEFGTYCGSTVPAKFTSFGDALTVIFVSQSDFQRSGFRFLYTSSTSGCGGELTAQSGYFNSPNYPQEYPVDTDCTWIISSSPGNRIELTFMDFSIEEHENCAFDYVQIREGSANGPSLARLCGSTLPANVSSIAGHILYVKFHSDVSTTAEGFQAYYQHLYGSTSIGEFTNDIASPMYPAPYPDLIEAYYYIYAPTGRLIHFQFSLLDLQGRLDEGCQNDVITIFDGDSINNAILMIACGTGLLPSGTTTQGTMLMWFKSDLKISGRGFYLTWTAVEGGGIDPNPTNVPTIEPGVCGSNHMVAPLAPLPIYSPGWPGDYPPFQHCEWLIEAAQGYRVEFTITMIDIESTGLDCNFDRLVVYNGPDTSSPIIGRYCGKFPPVDPIYSSDEFMLVIFESDNSLQMKGFSGIYQQACGGTLTGNQGVISSPNYPSNYPSNTDCVWIITATLGFTISLDFNSQFEIINSDSSDCKEDSGDYVQILNGREDDAPPLPEVAGSGRYCGTNPPSGLETSSHFLYVKFSSDDANSGKGFSLTYTASGTGCGGNLQLTDEITSGTFSSPDYPSAYPHGADCIWVITCPVGEAIQLDFTTFNLEAGSSCLYDYVLVIDGQTSNDPILGRYCSSSQPPTTKSTGNTMLVRFRTDETISAGGFQATYKIAACGGTLVGTSGVITSPNYPNNYPDSTICDWQVRGPAYHFLIFQFTQLDLNGNSDCDDETGDFVEFRLSNATAPPFTTVCGSDLPGSIDTEDNIAHIRFKSDASGNSDGFRLEFKASEDICGGELVGPGGTLMSPNYPNAYDHARTCTWFITVAADRRITLQFNVFSVEDPHQNFGCVYDYVEVYNGILPNSPRLGRYCGNTLPSNKESTGNTMKVIFQTDASLANGGFLATYTSYEPRICGGVLGDSEGGLFATPNFPENYNNYQECIWTISNPNLVNSTILITFNEFNMEHHIVCDFDKVIFKAGTDYSGYLYQTLCGDTKPKPFGMALPNAFVQFISDISVTDKGFQASYKFKPCGGLVTGTTNGVIASSNYPDPYNDNDYCLWTIAVPAGQHIKLHWTDFNVESHSSCGYDYVKIYNGPTPSSPLVGSYCNNNKPTDYTAGSNTITILFQSDYSVPEDGWRVEWSADMSGCGNVIIHKQSGEITSPNYPNDYAANLNCIWTIITDPAYHLDVTFDDNFAIEQHEECLYDFIAIYDGPSESSTELDRFCGPPSYPTAPDDDTVVESSGATMTLRFRSDFSGSGTGFKAYYEAHCGLTLTNEAGYFQSPNYPSPYNNNEYCLYTITYSSSSIKFIKLTFLAFNIEAGSEVTLCDFDYVAVYAGNSTSSPPVGKYCGNTAPQTPLTSENAMVIEFVTDPGVFDYGFQAEYESADCGGLLTSTYGNINAFTHSNLHHNRNCTWQIQVSPNKVVELEFTSFDIEAHGSCGYDYVKVYDGFSTDSPLIGIYCGTFAPKYLISSSNTMTIELITDGATTEDGFMSTYRQMAGPLEGCGGTLTSATGNFSSIDLDGNGNYDPSLNCLWIIQASVNEVITVSFSQFKLENGTSNGCIYDKIEIHDGQTEFDPIAVVACGISIPPPFTSSGNFLSIRFFSDPYIENSGFVANYVTQNRSCGGQYMASEEFQKISFPPTSLQSMDKNVNCRWIIDAGTDITKYILVKFTYVDIQSPANIGANCNSAYLEIKDYPPGDTGQSFKYCNNSHAPVDFHSFGQIVQINARTDSETAGRGFSIQYKVTNCTKKLDQEYGQLFSPGWPVLYPHDTVCVTIFTVPVGNQIQMFFNFFELEYHPNCTYDYIDIRDGLDASAPLLQRLCGFNLPNPIFPSSNSVYLELNADPFVHEKGYDITYTSTPEVCGGIITGDHGTITSFNFPQAYAPNTTCEFSIQAPSGRPVTLHIDFIDIYYVCDDTGCRCVDDVLWLYAGPYQDSQYIAGYCGYGRLSDIQSPLNSAFVKFDVSSFAEGTRSNTGFRIRFES